MPEPTTDLGARRTPAFKSLYANNVKFESSVWDLKLILGELNQTENPPIVEQHTAVSLPWQQARLTAYYLILNTAVYEAANGRMLFPVSILPPRPDPSDPALDEAGKKLLTYLAWVHDQFFSDHPYIPPQLDQAERAEK
jgi:hypothetical protein